MSETYKGDYAPDLFNENKHYYLLQAQEKANLTDAELRDLNNISNTYTRRFIQNELGDAVAIRDGFKIIQGSTVSDQSNNFQITGADSTGVGSFYLQGYRLALNSTIKYTDQTAFADHTSESAITQDGFTMTVLPSLRTPTGTQSNLTGVALKGSNVFSCGDQTVIRTTDWGRNWIPKTLLSTAILNSVSFSDSSTGIMVDSSGDSYYTADAGVNWILKTVSSGTILNDAFLVNQNYVWIVGQDGTIINSLNASAPTPTWAVFPTGVTVENLNGVTVTDSTISPSDSNVIAVGDVSIKGTIVQSMDSGSTWSLRDSSTTNKLNRVFASDATVIYAIGDSGTILRSVNSGVDWTSTVSDTTVNLNGLFFANRYKGWVVGDSGVITQTDNSGDTWQSKVIATGVDFKGIVFSDTTGFAIGSAGKIYRTLDGTKWESYRTDSVYIDFHLAEVSGDATSGSEYVDPGLVDSTIGLPSANRLRLVSDVKVSEGWPIPADYSPDGTVQHYTTLLAKIQRYVDQSSISQADITDCRSVLKTISELDFALKNGGVDSSALADGAVTPLKIQSTGNYTVGSINITGDASVGGNLEINGDFISSNDVTVRDLTVNGRAILGDSSSPYDATHYIYGTVIQIYDGSATAPAYDIHVTSPLDSTPVINISSVGSGQIFKINRDNTDSSSNLFDLINMGSGYDFNMLHAGSQGGILNAVDDATGNSINIAKNGYGSVLNIVTDSTDPTINISNMAPSSTSITVNQIAGTLVSLNSTGDATSIEISSNGLADDIHINHAGSQGRILDVTSASFSGSIGVLNNAGIAVNIKQTADVTLMSLDKSSAGMGLALEINNRGADVGLGVYNTGTGLGQLISHVGDSTQPGLDIFIAGTESGAALRINKSNDATGEAILLWNQGWSESLLITQDRTDSSATVISIDNKTHGPDISSNNWQIDNSGNFYGKDFSASGNLYTEYIGLANSTPPIPVSGVYLYFDGTDVIAKRSDGSTSLLSSIWM